jgi:hypothetical protein
MYWMPLTLLVIFSLLSIFFLIGFFSGGIFHVALALGMGERHTGSLVREHFLHTISSKSSRSFFVHRVE